jgi:Na+-transporting methylmalonyl-CoA/oxaloacetate decarboxylase gamma subunit
MFQLLNILYETPLGSVSSESLSESLWLMLKGMGGIFVVMLLIFLVILLLNRLGKKRNQQTPDDGDEQK